MSEATANPDRGHDAKLNRGGIAWAIFEGGRDPFVILITIYIFMPYVAGTMIGDPVQGQAIISRWQQWAGWAVMATAPFLGASIDKLGRRKGMLGLIVGLMIPLTALLWFAKPDGSGLTVAITMLIAMTVQVLFNYNEILHNSLLVRAAGLESAHKASGLALSLGNLFSVLALVFTAWAFALPGQVDWSWVPAAPLFGLDAATHEPQRVVALMAAALLLLGSIPLFLFTPDAPPTGIRPLKAFADGAAQLWRMLKTISHYRDPAVYIGSRMFFVDGMNGVLVYAGVYAVGVMKWGALEMLGYGILLSIFAVLGGFVFGGVLFVLAGLAGGLPWVAVALMLVGSVSLVVLDVAGGLPFLMAVKPSERTEMSAVYSSFRDVSGILTPGAAWLVLWVAPLPGIFLAAGVGLLSAWGVAGRLNPRLGLPRPSRGGR